MVPTRWLPCGPAPPPPPQRTEPVLPPATKAVGQPSSPGRGASPTRTVPTLPRSRNSNDGAPPAPCSRGGSARRSSRCGAFSLCACGKDPPASGSYSSRTSSRWISGAAGTLLCPAPLRRSSASRKTDCTRALPKWLCNSASILGSTCPMRAAVANRWSDIGWTGGRGGGGATCCAMSATCSPKVGWASSCDTSSVVWFASVFS